jgi:hypothetical protein
VLAYLTPQRGVFLFGIALGDRVATRACEGRLPARVRSLLEEAPKYAEGRGIRFEVRTAADAGVAARLLALKVGDVPMPRARRRAAGK